jgi:hypothetical protein
MRNYTAPWSTLLIVISSLVTTLCASIAIGLVWSGRGMRPWFALLPIAIIAGSALLTIRGYTVTTGALLIHRLLWTTRLPLGDLQSARFEPDAMRGSLRLLGIGGLFSYTGHYRSKNLGSFRAYATDLRRTVVLRFPARTIVVSPAAPEDFVREVASASHLVRSAPPQLS